MMTLEIPTHELINIPKTQRQLIEHQEAVIANLSRCPSEASAPMRVDRFGIDQLADDCQKLTLAALQETAESNRNQLTTNAAIIQALKEALEKKGGGGARRINQVCVSSVRVR